MRYTRRALLMGTGCHTLARCAQAALDTMRAPRVRCSTLRGMALGTRRWGDSARAAAPDKPLHACVDPGAVGSRLVCTGSMWHAPPLLATLLLTGRVRREGGVPHSSGTVMHSEGCTEGDRRIVPSEYEASMVLS